MTAIRATYSDLKLVKTRKVLQLIFEVPIEEADNALRVLGGMPRADAETWVGIAPITEEAATRAPTPTDKPKRRMADLSRAQQAGIHCGAPLFCQFLVEHHNMLVDADETIKDAAVGWVRRQCRSQRRYFDTNPDAAELWDQLRAEYDAWTGKIGWPDEQRSAE